MKVIWVLLSWLIHQTAWWFHTLQFFGFFFTSLSVDFGFQWGGIFYLCGNKTQGRMPSYQTTQAGCHRLFSLLNQVGWSCVSTAAQVWEWGCLRRCWSNPSYSRGIDPNHNIYNRSDAEHKQLCSCVTFQSQVLCTSWMPGCIFPLCWKESREDEDRGTSMFDKVQMSCRIRQSCCQPQRALTACTGTAVQLQVTLKQKG